MSIYSGFATRQQEQTYDHLLLDLLDVLQRRIIKFYLGHEADEHKFHNILTSIQHHLLKMEHNKYLPPKFAASFRPLLEITTTIVANQQSQVKNEGPGKNGPLEPESLSFSREKLSENMKEWSFGKIRHQLAREPKEDTTWLKGFTNPEQQSTEKQVKRTASSYVPKSYRSKKWADKLVRDESDLKLALESHQKKQAQYLIRQFVGRGRSRQIPKKKSFLS